MPTLREFHDGECARLTSFSNISPAYRQRLLSMGLTPGAVITVVRKAPLGCPIQVNIRHTTISLRLDEVNELQWERIE
ncbi:ferrous iron transport protein A [Legionella sp. W05-934-2]|jgi:ferrous iron transport protein A|uniref:FeoA family protein n=1 Tax=Legionella sp. W05-934-2 TaxID=1198649 RepID=UPI0034636D64